MVSHNQTHYMDDAAYAAWHASWHSFIFGDIELSWPPGDGMWFGQQYMHFFDRSTGREGELHGRAAMLIHAYMTGPWWPLIEPRLKECGVFMGGDVSHYVTEKFKEDEQDRIDMQAIQMAKWLDDRAKAELLEHSKKEFEEIKASLKNNMVEIVQLEAQWAQWVEIVQLEAQWAQWAEYLNHLALEPDGKKVLDVEVVNVQEAKPKVQSQVWQKQSGLRSTAPNFSAITSFTTRDSKPKLNGG